MSASLSIAEAALRVATPACWAMSVSGSRWGLFPHLRLIDDVVTRFVTGQTRQTILILEAPPRHGKSEYVSKYLPSWYLGVYPDRHIQLAAYQAHFASDWGRKCRDLLIEHGPSYFGVQVRDDLRAANAWGIAGRDGTMHTAGIGGPMTGRGAHLLIVDDPIKNAEEAMSELILDRHWDWWQSTASTRLEPNGRSIVMCTRWAERDLPGRLIAAAEAGDIPPILRIRLPALAGEDDLLGRAPGDALWPERYSREKLIEIKESKSAFWWNALYDQRPSRHDSAEWPDEYFGEHIWTDYWPASFERSALYLDPSKGRTEKSDFSALVFVGLSGGLLWVDANIARRDVVSLAAQSVGMFSDLQPQVFGLESNAWQDLLAGEFDRLCRDQRIPPLPVHLVENTVNKHVRIARLGPYLSRRKIRLRRTDGNRLLLRQLRGFPLAEHDDGPDALEGAIRCLNQLAYSAEADTETTYGTAY